MVCPSSIHSIFVFGLILYLFRIAAGWRFVLFPYRAFPWLITPENSLQDILLFTRLLFLFALSCVDIWEASQTFFGFRNGSIDFI